MAKYMCDFETTTNPEDCRVWAAAAVDMETGEKAFLGETIEDFMGWLMRQPSSKIWFHNLRFDGEFIISHLLFNGYRHVPAEVKAVPAGAFSTLIDDMGQFYKITICFARANKKVKRVEIFDSLKKLPDKAAKIAKDYGLEIAKGEIDYTKERPRGYHIDEVEEDYILTDCRIIQQALSAQLAAGMGKMTVASDALAIYKDMMGRKFEYWFPVLPVEMDATIRKAYRGGFTWCKPETAGKDIGGGVVLDINSMYPNAMFKEILPWGYPIHFEGEPEPDETYPLYIVQFRCAFRIKPKHIPTVQIKGGKLFADTEYLYSSEVRINGKKELQSVLLCMTNVDYELFRKHYEVIGEVEWIDGYYFRGQRGMFNEYIEHWMHEKATSPKGSAQRAIAKLMLNSLYGRFATSTERYNKVPVLAPNGVVKYYCRSKPKRDEKGKVVFDYNNHIVFETDEEGKTIPIEPAYTDPIYTPVAVFITAYARRLIIESAQTVYDRILYCDTDSMHLEGTEMPEGVYIHPTDLGAWDHEKTFTRARFLRAKTYIEEVDGKLEVTCAGMPDNVKYYDPEDPEDRPELHPTWDNFHAGSVYPGKLAPKRVRGGVVLVPIDFGIHI